MNKLSLYTAILCCFPADFPGIASADGGTPPYLGHSAAERVEEILPFKEEPGIGWTIPASLHGWHLQRVLVDNDGSPYNELYAVKADLRVKLYESARPVRVIRTLGDFWICQDCGCAHGPKVIFVVQVNHDETNPSVVFRTEDPDSPLAGVDVFMDATLEDDSLIIEWERQPIDNEDAAAPPCKTQRFQSRIPAPVTGGVQTPPQYKLVEEKPIHRHEDSPKVRSTSDDDSVWYLRPGRTAFILSSSRFSSHAIVFGGLDTLHINGEDCSYERLCTECDADGYRHPDHRFFMGSSSNSTSCWAVVSGSVFYNNRPPYVEGGVLDNGVSDGTIYTPAQEAFFSMAERTTGYGLDSFSFEKPLSPTRYGENEWNWQARDVVYNAFTNGMLPTHLDLAKKEGTECIVVLNADARDIFELPEGYTPVAWDARSHSFLARKGGNEYLVFTDMGKEAARWQAEGDLLYYYDSCAYYRGKDGVFAVRDGVRVPECITSDKSTLFFPAKRGALYLVSTAQEEMGEGENKVDVHILQSGKTTRTYSFTVKSVKVYGRVKLRQHIQIAGDSLILCLDDGTDSFKYAVVTEEGVTGTVQSDDDLLFANKFVYNDDRGIWLLPALRNVSEDSPSTIYLRYYALEQGAP